MNKIRQQPLLPVPARAKPKVHPAREDARFTLKGRVRWVVTGGMHTPVGLARFAGHVYGIERFSVLERVVEAHDVADHLGEDFTQHVHEYGIFTLIGPHGKDYHEV